ncbi:MAG: alkaline phosphatase family protein [Candidatus Velamenicoccus archaeovorus]
MSRLRSVASRRLLALSFAVSLAAGACSGSSAREAAGPSGAGTSAPSSPSPSTLSPVATATSVAGSPSAAVPGSPEQLACSIPHQWLLRTWRGFEPDRGADIQLLPKEYDFIGSGLPHVGPWGYVNDVPMFWYGPGHIQARGVVNRPVTVAGIAPTAAELLRFDRYHAPDGIPMDEAIVPGQQPPKLIVTMVWDAGGMDVLDRWKDAWPYLRSLIPQGTWYANATVGSSPTSTAQIHATIGTGAFPDHHGLIGHRFRIGDRITTPWAQGPAYLMDPTLADLYDRAMANRPVVGELGTVSIHLGMLGHGAMWGGGDRDIAVTREVAGAETLGAETFQWNLSPLLRQFFRFPGYVNDVPGFQDDVRAVDAADGQIDGKWRDNDIAQLLNGFDTPARTPYQTRVLEEMIRREGFGADDVPDLLYVNYKEIDYISHVWSVDSLEMRDAVVAQDVALKELIGFLNQQVGPGNWVLALTADHGSMIPPRVSGGFQISSTPIAAGINARFDHDGDDTHVVELIQPTQIFIDTKELQQNGYTLTDVSKYLMTLTQAQTAGAGVAVDPATANQPVFQAVFPSSIMKDLPCLPEARSG